MRFKCRGWKGIKEFMKEEQGVGDVYKRQMYLYPATMMERPQC